MFIVHHLENSRSQRILWMLEELGAEYEIKRYERDKATSLAPAELKKIHPLGKSPLIEHNGRMIAETGSILEYLVACFGGAMAPDLNSPEYLRYNYWIHAAEGSYMPALVMMLFLNRMETAPMPFFVRPIAKRLTKGVRDGYLDHTAKALFDYLHDELEKSSWLAGEEISGADIAMSFPMEAFAVRGDMRAYPRIARYVETIHARRAYKRALERGGPYSLLG